MYSKCKRGRDAAEATWGSIKAYIKTEGEKNAEFSTSVLRGYDSRGFQRLIAGGVIKTVRVDRARQRNVYRLGERILSMDLEDILKLGYGTAMSVNGK